MNMDSHDIWGESLQDFGPDQHILFLYFLKNNLVKKIFPKQSCYQHTLDKHRLVVRILCVLCALEDDLKLMEHLNFLSPIHACSAQNRMTILLMSRF